MSSSYFGESQDTDLARMAEGVGRSPVSTTKTAHGYSIQSAPNRPTSYLRPMTAYGEGYTPSYTRYLNAPGSSYVHPNFPLFHDRRSAPQIRTSLNTPGRVPGLED